MLVKLTIISWILLILATTVTKIHFNGLSVKEKFLYKYKGQIPSKKLYVLSIIVFIISLLAIGLTITTIILW